CDHARNHASHQRPGAVWPRRGRGQPDAGRGPDRPLGARCPTAGSRSAAAGLRVRGQHHDQRRARAPGVCAGGDVPAECALCRSLSTVAARRARGRVGVLEGAIGDRMTTPSYDTDFYAWAQQQAEAWRAKDWAALDIEHLAEEVEDLRKTERRAVRSQLRLILSHLLKWRYQPLKRTDSWRSTIANGRV